MNQLKKIAFLLLIPLGQVQAGKPGAGSKPHAPEKRLQILSAAACSVGQKEIDITDTIVSICTSDRGPSLPSSKEMCIFNMESTLPPTRYTFGKTAIKGTYTCGSEGAKIYTYTIVGPQFAIDCFEAKNIKQSMPVTLSSKVGAFADGFGKVVEWLIAPSELDGGSAALASCSVKRDGKTGRPSEWQMIPEEDQAPETVMPKGAAGVSIHRPGVSVVRLRRLAPKAVVRSLSGEAAVQRAIGVLNEAAAVREVSVRELNAFRKVIASEAALEKEMDGLITAEAREAKERDLAAAMEALVRELRAETEARELAAEGSGSRDGGAAAGAIGWVAAPTEAAVAPVEASEDVLIEERGAIDREIRAEKARERSRALRRAEKKARKRAALAAEGSESRDGAAGASGWVAAPTEAAVAPVEASEDVLIEERGAIDREIRAEMAMERFRIALAAEGSESRDRAEKARALRRAEKRAKIRERSEKAMERFRIALAAEGSESRDRAEKAMEQFRIVLAAEGSESRDRAEKARALRRAEKRAKVRERSEKAMERFRIALAAEGSE